MVRPPAPAHGAARQAANSEALDKAARLGFVAKGLVYALIGVLAFQVAFGANAARRPEGRAADHRDKPGGSVVLWLMVLGFLAYAVWRFSEAAWGRRDETDEKKRTAKRIGSARQRRHLPVLRRARLPHRDQLVSARAAARTSPPRCWSGRAARPSS